MSDSVLEKVDIAAEEAQVRLAIAHIVKEGMEKGWTTDEIDARIKPIFREVFERTGLAAGSLGVNFGTYQSVEEIAEKAIEFSFSYISIDHLRYEGRLK